MTAWKIGEGITAFRNKDPVNGKLKIIASIDDVRKLRPADFEGKIILVKVAGVSGLMVPLLKARGIICTTGGIGSHLAILAREFRVPCIMGVSIDDPVSLDGRDVIMNVQEETGSVFLESV
jgi:phosphohistidine swiveling domain-containing protein